MGLFSKKPARPTGTVKTKSNGQLVPARSSGFCSCECGEVYELRDSNNVPVGRCPACGSGH